MIKDSLFKKIENKTNIDKSTIISIANKIQKSDLKDKNVLSELVDELSTLAGKNVSQEKKDKIINAIVNDKVPNNLDNMM